MTRTVSTSEGGRNSHNLAKSRSAKKIQTELHGRANIRDLAASIDLLAISSVRHNHCKEGQVLAFCTPYNGEGSVRDRSSMTKLHLRRRLSRWLVKDDAHLHARQRHRPNVEPVTAKPAPGPETTELRSRRCGSADRVFYKTRRVGRLRSDLAYFQDMCNNVLIPSIPVIQWHCDNILSAVRECNKLVAEIHATWQRDAPQQRFVAEEYAQWI